VRGVRRSGRLSRLVIYRSAAVEPTPGRTIAVPPNALVLLIGIAGSGKTTFARAHFAAPEIVSSDALRALVAGDPTDQTATDDAFELLHTIVGKRLRRGLLTLVDATNVEAWARARLLDIAWRARRPAIAIVLDPGARSCARAQPGTGRWAAPAVSRQAPAAPAGPGDGRDRQGGLPGRRGRARSGAGGCGSSVAQLPRHAKIPKEHCVHLDSRSHRSGAWTVDAISGSWRSRCPFGTTKGYGRVCSSGNICYPRLSDLADGLSTGGQHRCGR
jgi:predicted kinase